MVKVLCYHRVSNIRDDYNSINVSIDNFRNQMEWLSDRYRMISLEDYDYYERSEEQAIAVTFDDGYRDVIDNALPILEAYCIPVTLFISTNNINSPYENWTDSIIRCIFEPMSYNSAFECHEDWLDGKWNVSTLEKKVSFYRKMNMFFKFSNAETREKIESKLLEWAGHPREGRDDRRIITNEQINNIKSNQLITIGAHTVTHPSLANQNKDEQEYEIKESIASLEEIIKKKVDLFAYPFGSKNDYAKETVDLLKKYGVRKAFTTMHVNNNYYGDLNYEIPRLCCHNYEIDCFKKWIEDELKRKYIQIKKEDELKSLGLTYNGYLENDTEIFDRKYSIVIWGCGFWGKDLYRDLQLCGLSKKIIAFGDNDDSKVGKTINGICVLGIDEIVKLDQEDTIIVLVKNSHDHEIVEQLLRKRINRIHLINRN